MEDTQQIAFATLSLSNHALASGSLPAELSLLRFGDNPSDRGVLHVTDRSLEAIAAQREAGVFDRVLIDFEHSSSPGSPSYQPPPRHHAGAGVVHCSRERGLMLEACAWSPSGEKYAKDYPDISPMLILDKQTNEVLGLKSVGLVPNGGVVGLSFFSANPNQEGKTMEDMKALTEQIGFMKKALDALQARVDSLVSTPPEALTALEAKVTQTAEAFVALEASTKAELARREKAAILADAARDGKVIALSAEAIEKLDAKELREHVVALAATVPVTRRTSTREGHDAGDGLTLIEQYNAIETPEKRAIFWNANRAKMFGAQQ